MFREEELPSVLHWPFAPWPRVPVGGIEVEFRLVYDGALPPAAGRDARVEEKHDIRRIFSPQLKTLWMTHPRLIRDKAYEWDMHDFSEDQGQLVYVKKAGQPFKQFDRNFIPLIREDSGVGCALDILFLRRDPPGSLIRSGGDIDNRIKVLFDALKMPGKPEEVFGDPAHDPDPFYCLLQDDRLITDFRVTTDRLLSEPATGGHNNDVRLIVHVRTIVIDPSLGALTF